MKNAKRIIALLLTALLLMAIPMEAFAAKAAEEPEAEVTEEVTEAQAADLSVIKKLFSLKKAEKEEEKVAEDTTVVVAKTEKATKKTEEKVTEQETSNLGKVATMYLFFTSANKKIPHLWIYIENNTDKSLQMGPYTIEPYGAVSMGAWKDRGDGAGIYINLERYWVKEATYGRAFYIKSRISQAALNRVGKSFERHNYWNWGFNCVWFALGVWNIATFKFIPFLFSPRIALGFMFLYGARRPKFTIKKETKPSRCYKYQNGGTLKVVKPGVLYTKTGV